MSLCIKLNLHYVNRNDIKYNTPIMYKRNQLAILVRNKNAKIIQPTLFFRLLTRVKINYFEQTEIETIRK
jgi:ABC-type molybdate transport system substrate-binding protein